MLIELRILQIVPGKMDAWLQAFTQELEPLTKAKGATVLGSFVNADSPNEFIWMRGYEDARAKEAFRKDFYESVEWKGMQDRIRSMVVKSENRVIEPTVSSALH